MNALVRLLARLARSRPVVVIVVGVLVTMVLGSFAGQAEQDQSNEAFSPDNEELAALEFSGEAFEGSSDTLVQVLIQGDDVVSPEGLQAVQAIRQAVTEAVPPEWLGGDPNQGPVVSHLAPLELAIAQGQLDPSVLSSDEAVDQAFSAALERMPPEISGLASQLIGGEGEPVDADTALGLVFLDSTAIVGDATGDDALTAQIDAVRQVAEAIDGTEAPLDASGFAFELFFEPDDSFNTEVARLFGIATLVIIVILLVVYLVAPRGDAGRGTAIRRAVADTALTLFAIIASITWMQGVGVLLGPDYLGIIGAFSPPTQIIPILLIGLGVDFAIHLTSRYREEIAEGAHVDDATGRAIGTVGVALVLATITTVVGFLTNATNPVPAIRDFGILAAVGILAAFLLMMTVVPAVRTLLDRRADAGDRLPRAMLASNSESRLSGVMARTSILAERAPAVVLAVTLVLGALGAYGLSQLSTEFSFADFVPDGSEIKETFVTIEDEFGGGFGERTTVLMQGDVATPAVHNATAAALADLADTEGVITFGDRAAADSPVALLGQVLLTAQAAQGGGEAPPGGAGGDAPQAPAEAPGGGLGLDPAEAAAFAQAALGNGLQPDLTFAEGADVAAVYDGLRELVPDAAGAVLAVEDGRYVASQVSVQTQSSEVGGIELADAVAADFRPVADAGVDVTPTSNAIVSDVIVSSLQSSQVASLAIAIVAALVLLVVVFGIRERRPELGVITILPVALVVLWVFGTMAATGIPFNPVTAMISALAIGIGVPFTIHITHRFTEDLEIEPELESALRSTMRHTGGALAGSAFTTMAGFLVLVSSSLPPFRQLGLVTAYAIGFSLLAAVIVLPSLLALWARWRGRRAQRVTSREAQPTTV